MKILFCNNLLEPSKVDPDFEQEWRAAKEWGFETLLMSHELLTEGALSEALKRLEKYDQEQTALYRGWMLTLKQYTYLYTSLLEKNIRLLNTSDAYAHCHYLPRSFHIVESMSPKTAWLPMADSIKENEIHGLLEPFGDSAVVVKDYVKSEKHYWEEACFIPNASDRGHALKVVHRFIELRGDALNEGLVVRKFEELAFLVNHPQSGMPLTREFRIFFYKGVLLKVFSYWNEGTYGDILPDMAPFKALAKRIDSEFFTMDVAQKKTGEWIVMELGDGQVSGIPDDTHTSPFYKALRGTYTGAGRFP